MLITEIVKQVFSSNQSFPMKETVRQKKGPVAVDATGPLGQSLLYS
jgi:hypothetical protein